MSAEPICGADIVIKALVDQGVDVVFGYPGGAVLPIYDSLFKQNALRHILVRQEGGAVHAADGRGRSLSICQRTSCSRWAIMSSPSRSRIRATGRKQSPIRRGSPRRSR